MKRFGLHILWFFLPMCFIAVVLEFALRNIPNDYAFKNDYLKEHAGNIEVLVLGSSHTYYGINPAYFSKKGFNAAYVPQSIDFDLALLKKYEKQLKKLHYLVVPVDYFTLYNSLEISDESWRMKNYALYYDLDALPFKYHFELGNGKFEHAIKRLGYYFKPETPITCNALGFGSAYKASKSLELEQNGKLAAQRHTAATNKSNEKLRAVLYKFVEFTEQHHIQLILVTCPAYYSYVNHLNKEQLNEMHKVICDAQKGHSNVLYFDFLKHRVFNASDFFDGDHLNDRGAKKFSLLLNQIWEE